MKKITIGVIVLLAFSIAAGTMWKGKKEEKSPKAKDGTSLASGELSWNEIMMMNSGEKRDFYLALTDSLPNLWETRDVDATSYVVEDSIPSMPADQMIHLHYRQKVSGYSVKVDLKREHNDLRYGQAVLHFSKSGHVFKVYCDVFSVMELASVDSSMLGKTIYLNYVPPKKGEYLSRQSPFYFKDMDYDGEDELVVNNLSMGSREYNTYDVFKVMNVEKPLRLMGRPFTEDLYKMTDYNVEYEPKSQSVIDKRYDGFDAYGYYRYKSVPSNEKNGFKRVFVLVDAEDMGFYYPPRHKASDSVNLIQPYKKYERVNGKLIMAERGVYELGNYGKNYNEIVLERLNGNNSRLLNIK